ncbi:PREDICTED: dynein heavy chain 6, axonemal [Nicrophorus vespilloides]|uniref:Dynein heavy chain 6, axonemal n=1 Tax=Nicrophorus vespilloides TaxID=110193 RepID=A0ABM1N001_NICVS|nr:PREDICTED: dynein heavy chain 6, axonemal [Nicrophorus vespilloides]
MSQKSFSDSNQRTKTSVSRSRQFSDYTHGDDMKQVCLPPKKIARRRDVIPFHIPHRSVLEKYEAPKGEMPEPLTGFRDRQLSLLRNLPSDVGAHSQYFISEVDTGHPVDVYFQHHDIILPHFKLSNVINQTSLINDLRTGKIPGFVYLIFAVPRSSEHYTPYALTMVPYEKIDKSYFLTMSAHGVLQNIDAEQNFTSLDKWEKEYDMYCRLMRFKCFFNFRKWKAFYVWKKTILFTKITDAGDFLKNNLFILNPLLRDALLRIRELVQKLHDATFSNISQIENQHLFYFIEAQMDKLETMQGTLKHFRNVTSEIISNACHGALLDKGFIVDETLQEQPARKGRDKKLKTSYIEQANKKKYAVRLCCFITLIDYLMVDMLHKLIVNSTQELIHALQIHYNFLPTDEEMMAMDKDDIDLTRPDDCIQLPLFIVDVLIKPGELYLNPSLQVTLNIFNQIQTLWEDTVGNVKPFIPDKLFMPFTQPIINGKIEDRICGFGPSLTFYITENQHLTDIKINVREYLQSNYRIAGLYINKLNVIMEFFTEDSHMEESIIEEERSLENFRRLCTKFHDEVETIENLGDSQPMGILYLQLSELKELTLPEPCRLIWTLERVMPGLGKEKVDMLMELVDTSQEYLENEPDNTVDYVKYLDFIDAAPGKADTMEADLDYCKELYDIMEEFKMPVSVDDLSNYLGLSVTMGTLRNTIDKKSEERDKIVKRFNDQLNKDINELIEEIGSIKNDCLEPWLYDVESNFEEVTEYLKELYEKLLDCQRRANEFKSFQKQFRLEVTRFDMLEEVMADVKLRMLLWDSVDSWEKQVKEWYEVDFNTLNVEDMNLFTAKNVKNITQLEKGLPKNLVVPDLKDSVECMKDKLPIITYLRNPALRQRHWLKIEVLLNHKFKPDEELTLELLESLKVFSYPEELMEISGQASSEFSLEALLKKVEEAWKSLEFPIIAHRDSKDVWILGSTEEVQAVLDESNINMNTISSSRHVGPIKPRVDEWIRLLDQFTRTLDEWLMCQQSWIYLEVIFSAPDIQRQLPSEAKMFLIVDKTWKEIMRRTSKVPLAMEAATYPGLLDALIKNNQLLEQIMKCLESYLETKRVAFPRFYFLSNDELLDILAQTRNPHAVQPHLRKCFDAISRLEFGTKNVTEGEDGELVETATPVLTTDIVAMISPEGERVVLSKGLKARGNVEDWLGKVEEAMFASLRKLMKASIYDHISRPRNKWVLDHANQIILTVSQIMWARDVHMILDECRYADRVHEMEAFEKKNIAELNKLAVLIRTDLPKVTRRVLIALITIDVHARDTISNMVKSKVTDSNNFEWLKMMRYYWVENIDNCVAKMSNASYVYGYEYLGAGGVLVITPLTDKCYLCLMGALQLDLGGAPAGPAGTGKTETTKDLAKSLAIQCVVFNCSEGLDYKMMGRFFSGLAQSGAWCCFDEFNRIDIEVLSVIAQQLITIRNAKAARLSRFMFEGREIKLVQTCAAFITMNPGYAGRTELPDNLKALFRPVSMMVPDYALIAEVTLYSEGFESSKILSHKMVQMYKLCSEQLSQQDHYDFGMRAVKSVLVMAGSLKRANPDRNEDVVLICALRDSNLPKFLADDALLFQGILNDLFPGVELPVSDYGVLEATIVDMMLEKILQPEPCMIKKVIQLHETMIVRWGVMLVGPTGGGKSAVLSTLGMALSKMYDDGITGPYFHPVHTYFMNPKAVTAGELYGEVNPFTLEWRDGLMGIMVRNAVQNTTEDHQWVVCDGPVDAVWIENLNTVLDDNKMLCLANSERIKLTPYVHMVFEVQDLAQASPATVSRCGMVYIDPGEIKWLPFVKSWLQKFDETILYLEYQEYICEMFETYVENGFIFIMKNCDYAIHQVDISKVSMVCALLQGIIDQTKMDRIGEKAKVKGFLCQSFVFSYIWGLGGNLVDSSKESFETYVREQFDDNPDARLPAGSDLWALYVDTEIHRLENWIKLMPQFVYDPEVAFFEMLVPTLDTVRYGYVMEQLINVNYPVLYTGGTGVGKSVIAKGVLHRLFVTGDFVPITMNFSAQTSSFRTQEILELKLEKRKKTLLGAPLGKRVILFVDDVNMPKLETYGAQPPIELLRQFLDYQGLYDREKLFWKDIKDVVLAAACAPPGGGRNTLTPRFVRHFGMLFIPSPNEYSLKMIFKAIIRGFFNDFSNQVRDIGDSLINAAVEIYDRISEDLLPTPAKSHYVFNLRDLSKCIQGILQADSGTMREPQSMLRLFCHECLRVFHDRLINEQDKIYFYYMMRETCSRSFGTPVLTFTDESIQEAPPVLLFGDFMVMGAATEDKIYEEIRDIDKMKNVLQDYLDDYNLLTSKEMDLIFFMDAVEHCTRIARILRSERGNGLLVGVGGMGKQSLTKLASHVNGYKCSQIELTRNYDHAAFFDDVRKMYFNAGVNCEDTVFLFTDTQIVQEEFLEDINNILNSGDVPNLFESDEFERVVIGCRSGAKENGIEENNRDGIFEFFIGRVRNKLHLVICMSPVGDAFRRRCRMFPSLVNCCTIDWFVKWPQEALLSVSKNSLKKIGSPELCENLSSVCVLIHESVEAMTERFYNEVKRYYYTTPSSYLELLKLYKNMLDTKKAKILKTKDRILNGLNKLYETNTVITSMKETLTAMEPELQKKSADVADLMVYLAKEQKQADTVRTVVKNDEENAKVQAEETQALAADAQKDLDTAMPAMEAAVKALESLNKTDINEIRVFQKPPVLVKFVMEAVCLLLGAKTDWASAKLVMGDGNFLKKLQEYDKNNIPESTQRKLKVYIDNKDFQPDIVASVSKVCKSMCMWVRAIDMYAKVYKIVEPKRKKLQAAEKILNNVMTLLQEKQRQLFEVESMIQSLQNKFDASIAAKKELEDTMDLTAARLQRAGRLNIALADEQIRWEQSIIRFDKELSCIVGDVLVAAACVAYYGAFTATYRKDLTNLWLNKCYEMKIPSSQTFSLIGVLADPYDIRMWNTWGLPRDNVSTDNGILVTQAGRWPLMIDPQEQAYRWIRQMEAENNLKIMKLTDSGYMRNMESAIRIGLPVLIEEVGETLDPTLAPILLKQTFVQGGRTLIRLGDSDVEYDSNFRLYITTKLANPHYLPEICIQVTLVNFTVTPSGLEEQLLADVVRLERPDLESLRTELVIRINNDKTQLQSIEDKILRMLYQSEGNILDDEELIDALNESKETSGIIEARLIETVATEEKISEAREKYRTVATRGSILYFVVAKLADIDPMYQYSLKYFTQVFDTVIEVSEKNEDLDIRLETLFKEITLAVYTNVSRGLFERHKLVYSFMLCVVVLKEDGLITDAAYNFLLRGPVGYKAPMEKKPDIVGLTDNTWTAVCYLEQTYKQFDGLRSDCLKSIFIQIGDFEYNISFTVTGLRRAQSMINWNGNVDDFDKLLLIKTLREEKLVFAITEYVRIKLGQPFVESPQVSLQILYQDTSNITPLVFVLSTGSDPFGAFQRFAADMGYTDRIQSISLGQGQGPVAEKLIEQGKLRGDWVFLQNCHLATSWMLSMEKIILHIAENPQQVHDEFRLFLSSMPCKTFPVSVLQNSVKVTNEPPKGLRANIKRAFIDMLDEFFEDHILGQQWKSMLFGLCMFHAVIQERKKFGPLGWNITYEFNDSDREFAFNTLQMYCAEGVIPWDALEYITGEITYGGRVTDYWDLRCLKTILKGFFAPHTVAKNYSYSESGVYYCPDFMTLEEYRNFIDELPILEEPEIFGMHENANIAYQVKETQSLINTIMESQPRTSGGGEEISTDDVVYELAETVITTILPKIKMDDANAKMFVRDDKGRFPSLTTVLKQEVDRFNKMLKMIHTSMESLQKAIKGLVLMSDALEEVYTAFSNNQVPKMWSARSYPSLKSLGSWIKDLELRLDFICVWLRSGQPNSYWISGFYFPQGFLTGTLQTHARKYNLPIDQLKFNFIVKPYVLHQEEIKLGHDNNGGKEDYSLYGDLEAPRDGVNLHGIYMDASRWDFRNMILTDPKPGEVNPSLPALTLIPVTKMPEIDPRYIAPLYKTSARAGTLSTTGHSTNFVISVLLPTTEKQSFWILKGSALLTQLTN